jgi:pentapeptide MXKDX repeat protein
MSRFFITAACALTLLGPAAFAQNSMGNSMSPGHSMSSGNSMAPDSMKKPTGSMTKPKTDTGMAPSNAMGNAMGNSMGHPSSAQ